MCEMNPFPLKKINKNPTAAPFLSALFMGFGQACNGQIPKAVIFLLLNALNAENRNPVSA